MIFAEHYAPPNATGKNYSIAHCGGASGVGNESSTLITQMFCRFAHPHRRPELHGYKCRRCQLHMFPSRRETAPETT